MKTREVHMIDAARQIVRERELDYPKAGLFDIDGVMRGKYMQRDRLLSVLDGRETLGPRLYALKRRV